MEIIITNDAGGILTTNINLPLGAGTNSTTVSYSTNTSRIYIRIQASQISTQALPAIVFTNFPQMMPGATAVQPMLASASFFEAYARLITLMLSILSVLGLFFAYFVRKSLREMEEDVEKRFDRTIKSWEKDQKAVSDQVAADAIEIKSKCTETQALYENVKQLKEDLTEAINELKRAEERLASTGASSTQKDVENATSALDAQLSNSQIPGESPVVEETIDEPRSEGQK